MVIQPKQTTVAYRCSHCGAGVMSAVGYFALSADMIKLKCTCGKSEMSMIEREDGQVRMNVPCLLCGKPHHFNVRKSLFFEKDLFAMQCPYSDINIALTGEINSVKAELARGELELMDLMEEAGIKDFELLHREAEELPDPQIREIVMFVIHDLDAEGKIYCRCETTENGREYDAEIGDEGILVSCRCCGAKRLIPTDSHLGAHAFLNADALHLE